MREILKGVLLLALMLSFGASGWGQAPAAWLHKAKESMGTDLDTSIHYWTMIEDWAVEHQDTTQLLEVLDMLTTLHRLNQDQPKQSEYAYRYLPWVEKYITKKTDQIMVYTNIGMSLEYKDNHLADSIFEKALVLAYQVPDTLSKLSVHSNFGHIKRSRGDLYGAVFHYTEALKYVHHDLPKSSMLHNLSHIFFALKNYERAEEYSLQAIQVAEANNFKNRESTLACTYAQILLKANRLEEAKIELERAQAYLPTVNKPASNIEMHVIWADYYLLQNDWKAAEKALENVWAYEDKFSDHLRCQVIFRSVKILIHRKEYSAALALTEQALAIAQSSKTPGNIKNAYKIIAHLQEELQETEIAYDAFKNYRRLEDSIYRTEQIAQLNFLEAQYNRKEQESAIALLDSENELQSNQLSQQRKLLIIGGISIALILSLLFFLSRLLQRIKGQNIIINKALSEKDTLLREIHHRVKNNLQLVSSLLGLQSRHIQDPTALEALNSGKSRVKSMALIHQDLYNRENLTGVSVKEYLEKLCQELILTYQIDTNKIKLKTDIADFQLDVDTLVPLGLIINELLTNALKYAFPNQRAGEIKVSLREHQQQLHLTVSDNGIGMDSKNISKSSFGYKLIDTLLDQLDGQIDRNTVGGTHLSLTFNDYKIAA